jgi:hypothetical protein
MGEKGTRSAEKVCTVIIFGGIGQNKENDDQAWK